MTSPKRVEFKTVDGVTLRGDLFMPNSGGDRAAIVVMTQRGMLSTTHLEGGEIVTNTRLVDAAERALYSRLG